MKKVLCGIAILISLASISYAGGWPAHTYELVTATAWTTADTTPVVIAGSSTTANFNAACNCFHVWEDSQTLSAWISYDGNGAGCWIPIAPGKDYANEMYIPSTGIYVKTTTAATIGFESKR